jgi:hippurate hydrolase
MRTIVIVVAFFFIFIELPGQKNAMMQKMSSIITGETEKYRELYIDLHRTPELSGMEFRTAELMARELESMGLEVTTKFGGNGVAGVFRNGKGKVIMLRADMDALPIKENTGLPFASSVVMKNHQGVEMPAMHACGHDLHMTVMLGTVSTLVRLKDQWKGTIVAIAQPAEELAGGAASMISAGLFKKFPEPDYILAYHVNADMPAGTIGYCPGQILAGVSSADLTVFGSGGHGANPHNTIDPIVLSARIILDIQTIVSREINPVKPAVITVGSIHGGTKHNIIPDEVKMLLTIRFFEDEVYQKIKEALTRITKNIAASAGLPPEKAPLIEIGNDYLPPVMNNNELVDKVVSSMRNTLGSEKVIQKDPSTGAEDFGKFGTTPEKIPIGMFWLGVVNNDLYKQHIENGTRLIPLHNSGFVPDFEPSYRCGVLALSKAVIDLTGNK